MLWINGLDLRQLLIIVVSVLVLASLPFRSCSLNQQDRVRNFIIPQSNVSYGATYNVEQALIAIGSGGLFGKGYGHGTQTQLRFLKVRHTDFIFSAAAEEFGLIGAVLVILVEIFIVWRCIRAAQKARDVSRRHDRLRCGDSCSSSRAWPIIAVNLKLIPVSGLPLPFISYGGSGLASLMLGVDSWKAWSCGINRWNSRRPELPKEVQRKIELPSITSARISIVHDQNFYHLIGVHLCLHLHLAQVQVSVANLF